MLREAQRHAGNQVHRGYPLESYISPDHPLQVEILSITADLMGVDRQSVQLATDGCSVPTFGASIASFANAYAHLARPETSFSPHAAALTRLRDAMMSHPANVSGHGNLVTSLMEIGSNRIRSNPVPRVWSASASRPRVSELRSASPTARSAASQ
ncbi:MAG: asparaginase [Thermomicrobiales bacterium]